MKSLSFESIPIDKIEIGNRYRRELGDIPGLMASIEEVGLLQPIVLGPEFKLIAGRRRLEAVTRLGWKDVPCVVIMTLGDAATALRAELQENTCREPMLPSEALALAEELEALVTAQAKERQREGGRAGGKACGKLPQASGKSRDTIGGMIGMSGRSYEKAREVKKAAEADPERFGRLMNAMDKTGKVDSAHRELKRMRSAEERERHVSRLPGDLYGIHEGDFRELGATIPDESVDFIFTDPPYLRDHLPLYSDLSRFASRVLRPGGWCLAYAGQIHLPEVVDRLREALTYGWQFIARSTGGDSFMFSLRLFTQYKPILGFYKPPLSVWWPCEGFHDIVSGGREKDDHPWQQAVGEAEHFIRNLCPAGGLVCDPFCGSGTSLVAAKNLGRKWIGFEIEPEHVKTARERVAVASADLVAEGVA